MQDAKTFMDKWEQINNPFYPGDMRWLPEKRIKLLNEFSKQFTDEIKKLEDKLTIAREAMVKLTEAEKSFESFLNQNGIKKPLPENFEKECIDWSKAQATSAFLKL